MIDISGALYLLRIHEYTQTRYEEGARDVISIWVPVVIKKNFTLMQMPFLRSRV